MNPGTRIVFVLLAVVVAVVAFAVLRPSDDGEEAATTQPVTATTATPESDAGAAATPTPAATPEPEPLPLLTADKVRRIKVEQGDTVRFEARSETDDEVHVHGYDVSKPAPAGKRIRMAFEADITGIFEIELEHTGTPIGELEVRP